MLSCHRPFEPTARLSTPASPLCHRTNRLSDRRLAITCSRISSGSIDMPPLGVTRSDCSLLTAAMKARSLACSEPDLLSRQTNSMHRHKKFISLSIAVEIWNAFSLIGRGIPWHFVLLIAALQQTISGFSHPQRRALICRAIKLKGLGLFVPHRPPGA